MTVLYFLRFLNSWFLTPRKFMGLKHGTRQESSCWVSSITLFYWERERERRGRERRGRERETRGRERRGRERRGRETDEGERDRRGRERQTRGREREREKVANWKSAMTLISAVALSYDRSLVFQQIVLTSSAVESQVSLIMVQTRYWLPERAQIFHWLCRQKSSFSWKFYDASRNGLHL